MIENFYITSKDILDPKDKSFSLYDPELTAKLMNGNNTFMDLLHAIEDFNGDYRSSTVDAILNSLK